MRKFSIALSVVFLMVLVFVSTANAAKFGIGDNNGSLNVDKNTVIDDNYITVGGQVAIDAKIKGDLLVFGGMVEINGPIEGNLIIGSGQVKVSSQIDQNVYAGAGQIEFTDESNVKGDMFLGSGNAILNGDIDGKLYAGTGNLIIAGKIKKGISANTGQITLKSTAEVGDNIKYTASKKMTQEDGSKITGSIDKTIIDQSKKTKSKIGWEAVGAGFATRATAKFLSLISTLIVGIILLLFFPKFSDKISSTINEKFWPSFGWGLLVLIVAPIIMLIATLVLVGFPLAMIMFGLYWLFIYLAKIFVGLCLGKYISKNKWSPVWSMSLGVLILIIIGLIPIIGGLANLVILLVGLGSVMITVKQLSKANK